MYTLDSQSYSLFWMCAHKLIVLVLRYHVKFTTLLIKQSS